MPSKLTDEPHEHTYAFLGSTPYRSITRKRYILEQYCCTQCGAGQMVYIPEVEIPEYDYYRLAKIFAGDTEPDPKRRHWWQIWKRK